MFYCTRRREIIIGCRETNIAYKSHPSSFFSHFCPSTSELDRPISINKKCLLLSKRYSSFYASRTITFLLLFSHFFCLVLIHYYYYYYFRDELYHIIGNRSYETLRSLLLIIPFLSLSYIFSGSLSLSLTHTHTHESVSIMSVLFVSSCFSVIFPLELLISTVSFVDSSTREYTCLLSSHAFERPIIRSLSKWQTIQGTFV